MNTVFIPLHSLHGFDHQRRKVKHMSHEPQLWSRRTMPSQPQENAEIKGDITPESDVDMADPSHEASHVMPKVLIDDQNPEKREGARSSQVDRSSAVDAIIIAVAEVEDNQALVEGQGVNKAEATKRELSLDLFRGLVMVFMVIDHALMMYVFAAGVKKTPGEHWDEISKVEYPQGRHKDGYDIFYFIIRSITNTVAPGFCMLMGMGLQLMIDSRLKLKWSTLQIIKYLVVRGAVIAVPMNLLIIIQRSFFSPIFQINNCILFALGTSPALASLIVVPLRTNVFISSWRLDTLLCALAGTLCLMVSQAIVDAHIDSPPTPTVLSTSFVLPGIAGRWKVNYSILPVLGITLLGASFGRISKAIGSVCRSKWRKFIFPFALSVIFFAAFCIVRASNSWGNTNSIKVQLEKGEVYWEAFFRTTKYPFSIAAALYSCGFNLLLLSLCVLLDLLDLVSRDRWLAKLPLELGGASLMGYIFHLWILMLLVLAVFSGLSAVAPSSPGQRSSFALNWLGKGGVLMVFLGFIFPVVLLSTYAVCKRFGAFKRGTAPDSLWRLL